MADILKVSSTMLKQPQVHQRNTPNPTVPFQINDVSKVNNLNVTKETKDQNQTILSGDGPTILLNMLNDPNGTIQFLKSIFLMKEVMGLLPLANNLISEDIEKLFQSLLLNPEELLSEILEQANNSTKLKGELFTILKHIVNQGDYEVANDIATLMKTINNEVTSKEILQSIKSNLQFLANQFKGLKLETKILDILNRINENENIEIIKKDLKPLLFEIEKSILMNPKISKNIGILKYNLSRYFPSNEFDPIFKKIETYLLKEDVSKLKVHIETYIENFEFNQDNAKVMKVLTKIIEMQVQNQTQLNISGEKIESIIYSLLASPSNFTPLLHFILPLDIHGLKAFGEMWIDPSIEDENKQKNDEQFHVLLAIEIEKMGHFELEIKSIKQTMLVQLYCPNNYVEAFKQISDKLALIVYNANYSIKEINVLNLEKPRTLMEVFENLPKKRSGVNLYA